MIYKIYIKKFDLNITIKIIIKMSDCFQRFKEILNTYFSSILCSTRSSEVHNYSLVNNCDDNDLSRFLIADEEEKNYRLFSSEDDTMLRSKIFDSTIRESITHTSVQSCPESCPIVYDH